MKRKLLLLVLVFIIIVCIFNSKTEDFVDQQLLYIDAPLNNIAKAIIATPSNRNPDYIQVAQIAIYDENGVNIAPTATISSIDNTYYNDAGNVASPAKAIDGTLAPRIFPNIYHSKTNGVQEYLKIVFPKPSSVSRIIYYNRSDCCAERANHMAIWLVDTSGNDAAMAYFNGEPIQEYDFYKSYRGYGKVDYAPNGIRYVKIKPSVYGANYIHFSQLLLYDETGKNVAPNGTARCLYGSYPGSIISKGIDGVDDIRSFPNITHCLTNKSNEYFEIDLQKPYNLRSAKYINRGECCKERSSMMRMNFYDANHVWLFDVELTEDSIQTFDLKYIQAGKKEDTNGYYKFDNGNFAAFKTIGERPLSFWPFF